MIKSSAVRMHSEASLPVALLCLFCIFLDTTLVSCKNDIQTINALTGSLDMPNQSGYDVEIIYTDSGRLQGKIIASELNRYDRVDEPYIEFPQGFQVFFYRNNDTVESCITAGYALFRQKDEIWEARNEVRAENYFTGEKLETEQLFWDQKNEMVYSNQFSKITNADGIFYGENGFTANQDLTRWTLNASKGSVNIRDEINEQSQ